MLLLISLLPLTFAGFFDYHIEHYLDHSIDPCDDFFAHVCPSSLDESQTIHAKWAAALQKTLAPCRQKEIREFLDDLKNSSHIFETEDERAKWLSLIEKFDVLEQNICFIKIKDKSWLISGQEGHYASRLLKWYKEYAEELFSMTEPWITQFGNSTIAESMKVTKLVFMPENVTIPDFRNVKERFDACTERGILDLIMPDCLKDLEREFVKEANFTPTSLKMDYDWSRTFSKNDQGRILVSPLFYMTEYDNDFYFALGSTLFILAHEIGHSLLNNLDAHYNGSTCFKEEMKLACHTYEIPENCLDDTFVENAADFMAMKIFQFGRKKMRGSEWRKFFYARAIYSCDKHPHPPLDSHSPAAARVNGINRMFKEFADAFQCKPGSRMVSERSCGPFEGDMEH